MNEVLFVIELFLSFSLVLLIYKFFNKEGLYVWMVFAVLVANIQVGKNIVLFSIVSTLGNPLYSSTFLACDILSENHGDRDARKGVFLSFLFMIFVIGFMQLTLLYVPDASDVSQGALRQIFGFFPRIVASSLAAYLASNLLDIYLFSYIKKKRGKYPWLRNNVSTLVSQAIDTFIFTFCSFFRVYENSVLWQIMLSTFLFKAIGAIIDTPFFYIARKLRPFNWSKIDIF